MTYVETDALRSSRHTGLAPVQSEAFGHTGTALPWWPDPADTFDFCSKGTAA